MNSYTQQSPQFAPEQKPDCILAHQFFPWGFEYFFPSRIQKGGVNLCISCFRQFKIHRYPPPANASKLTVLHSLASSAVLGYS